LILQSNQDLTLLNLVKSRFDTPTHARAAERQDVHSDDAMSVLSVIKGVRRNEQCVV